MSQENVEVVARAYEYGHEVRKLLLQGDDLSDHPWLSLWHPECVLEEVADVPDTATYHGRQGVARYFKQLGELWDDLVLTPVQIVEGDDGVLAVTDTQARSQAGVPTDGRVFQVFRFKHGMIVYATGYVDREQALAAAGLSE
jgi:ketosteroid isomerase-like protein